MADVPETTFPTYPGKQGAHNGKQTLGGIHSLDNQSHDNQRHDNQSQGKLANHIQHKTTEDSKLSLLFQILDPILINSDTQEANKNLSTFLKEVVEFLKDQQETYHTSSVLALRLLNLNLFIRNYKLCVGKLLGLVAALSQYVEGDCATNSAVLKEVILIILLLTLKLASETDPKKSLDQSIILQELMATLSELGLFDIICGFLCFHLTTTSTSHASFVLLKFNCDIICQYLYQVELLSPAEFESLTSSPLIPTLVSHLLSNENFNCYNYSNDEDDSISTLIACEEFKLLLLINEQYMMRSLSSNNLQNKVFDGLIHISKNSVNGICGFTNLLVYHMNREDSATIKILLLKFLYLIFTSSYSARLPYLNDLKILVDIIIRELNDMNYSSDSEDSQSSFLALTYLKILYPLLKFSQLSEVSPSYKPEELRNVLSDIIVNSASPNQSAPISNSQSNSSALANMAMKCLSVPCIKQKKSQPQAFMNKLANHPNSSEESVSSSSSLSYRIIDPKITSNSLSSTESFSIARVPSVRATNKDDFRRSTQTFRNKNINRQQDSQPIAILLSSLTIEDGSSPTEQASKLLNIPYEIIKNQSLSESANELCPPISQHKRPPPPPPRRSRLPLG